MLLDPPPHLLDLRTWSKIFTLCRGDLKRLTELKRENLDDVGLGRDKWIIIEAAKEWMMRKIPIPSLFIYWYARKRFKKGNWSRGKEGCETGVISRYIELSHRLGVDPSIDPLFSSALKILRNEKEAFPAILGQGLRAETGSTGRLLYALSLVYDQIKQKETVKELMEKSVKFLLDSLILKEKVGWDYYHPGREPKGIATALALRGLLKYLSIGNSLPHEDLEKIRKVIEFLLKTYNGKGWDEKFSDKSVSLDTTYYNLEALKIALSTNVPDRQLSIKIRNLLNNFKLNMNIKSFGYLDKVYLLRIMVLLGEVDKRLVDSLLREYGNIRDIYQLLLTAIAFHEAAQKTPNRKLFSLPRIPPRFVISFYSVSDFLTVLGSGRRTIKVLDALARMRVLDYILGSGIAFGFVLDIFDSGKITNILQFLKARPILATACALISFWLFFKSKFFEWTQFAFSFSLSLVTAVLALKFILPSYSIASPQSLMLTMLISVLIDVIAIISDKSGIFRLLVREL